MSRDLAGRLGRLLTERRLTLALAESCTGGLVGHLITNIPGSSEYFLGSAVTYSYDAKERLLGVPHDVLLTHGAVSAEVAREMARGARALFESDIAVAVTGIAGPGGGLPGKPVGLVCLHLTAPGVELAEQYVWDEAREANKQRSAEAVLSLAIRYVEGRTDRPG